MKKKIFFMLINMNVGGTEKALLNMLSEIPTDKYDITVYMLEDFGGFAPYIPKEIKVEYFPDYSKIKDTLNNPPHLTALNLLKRVRLIAAFKLIFIYTITKITKDRSVFFNYLLRSVPKSDINYDLAIAYDGPMDFISYFILKKVRAKQKLQWIHFDITKIGFNRKFARKTYKKFDKIFVVSNEGLGKVNTLLPSIASQTEVFSNIISTKLIYSEAKKGKGFLDEFQGIRILTVGRLSSEKGQDIAIRVLARLVRNGYNVKWYCVGEGNLKSSYEKLIKEEQIEDKFILLGSDPNPYTYMDQCDIYVQPSRHEGFCITLAEARSLNKAIITTDFTGAKEQIKNGETGLIVSCEENEIYDGIIKLINNPDLCIRFSTNLSNESIDSTEEINKLMSI
ncbi:glycosyltransferase [Peribacillus sp. NPDC097675]|uniref:glycosyltransferase n=1 Tax=Peribacillus sp. NPDC097675 TaxID=3390618 RepID=UPI003D0509E4